MLDRLICRVRDCFVDKSTGIPRIAATGEPTDLCIGRRKNSSVIVKADLNVRALVTNLKKLQLENRQDWGAFFIGGHMASERVQQTPVPSYAHDTTSRASRILASTHGRGARRDSCCLE